MIFKTKRKKKMVLFVGQMLQKQCRKHTTGTLETEGIGNNHYVNMLSKRSRLKDALHIFRVMDHPVDCSSYVSFLQGCLSNKALIEGKLVHAHMIQRAFIGEDVSLRNILLTMYTKCGSLVDARRVFDQMPNKNVVSWTVMISGYARHGHGDEALKMFYEMQRTGIQPNQFTFTSVLTACDNLENLKEVHEIIIKSSLQADVFVGSALVDVYAKCGSIENARNVFDKMPQRNVVSWTAMISGYAQGGRVDEALKLFQKMPERNVVSWNAMIAGYAQNGYSEDALKLYREMQLEGVKPNSKTFVSVLSACANLESLEQGKYIHQEMIRSGLQFDVFVECALIDMYAKCESIENARDVFDKMKQRDVASWNSMIAGYAQIGHVDEALKLFEKMPERNVVSWNTMIAGFAQNGYVDEALKLFHRMPQKSVVSWNTMICGYTQNGLVDEALKLFEEMPERNGVSWSAMISGYVHNGNVDEALRLFRKTPQQNVASWNAMISGFAQNGQVEEAVKFFQEMPEPNVVSWTAMITGYAQNGYVNEALKLFQKMPEHDVVSWNAVIAVYAQNGHNQEALELFRQMQLAVMKPNSKTFASVLPACANLAGLEQGKEVHEEVIRRGFQSDVFVGGALVDMYAKCGSIENARCVFDKISKPDVVSWNVMIAGYAMHGCGKEALKLFEEMQHSSMRPDHVTLVGVLSACCHAGLVDEGRQYFGRMSQIYCITPEMEHYSCMVDLLGRAGCLDEAQDFISKMPIKPNANVWGCLLGACRIHNNIELAEDVAEHLFKSDPKNAAPYVLLSNIYAAAGRWDDIARVRKMMKDRGVIKSPGCSWIEVNQRVYAFLAEDRSCPQM